jgi:hypothetical protein
MTARVLLLASCLAVAAASAEEPLAPLVPAVDDAAVRVASFVGEVRIVAAREETYLEGGEARVCGYVYDAEILSTLRGEPAPTIAFFSPLRVRFGHGETHLAAVREEHGNPHLGPRLRQVVEEYVETRPALRCELRSARARAESLEALDESSRAERIAAVEALVRKVDATRAPGPAAP